MQNLWQNPMENPPTFFVHGQSSKAQKQGKTVNYRASIVLILGVIMLRSTVFLAL